jgi:hypothetical protein
MSTHRYPLPDGRQLEIDDPAMEGRAHFSIDGETLGQNTIEELRTMQTIALRDGSALTIQVVNTLPFFRSYDVRVEGALLGGATSKEVFARRVTIGTLLLVACGDFASIDFYHLAMGVGASALAFLLWRRWDRAEVWAKRFLRWREFVRIETS